MENFTQRYFQELKKAIDGLDHGKIKMIIDAIFNAYKNGKQIFIIGNGGSSATASHFACDLGKGTLRNIYGENEKRFRVISLTDNVATLAAYGNDMSFDDIFVQQLKNLLNEGDVVVGISGSGNSPNVVKAMLYAKEQGAKTIGLLGFKTGGKLAEIVENKIVVDDNHYGRIEDIHLMLCHIISDAVFLLKSQNSNNT